MSRPVTPHPVNPSRPRPLPAPRPNPPQPKAPQPKNPGRRVLALVAAFLIAAGAGFLGFAAVPHAELFRMLGAIGTGASYIFLHVSLAVPSAKNSRPASSALQQRGVPVAGPASPGAERPVGLDSRRRVLRGHAPTG